MGPHLLTTWLTRHVAARVHRGRADASRDSLSSWATGPAAPAEVIIADLDADGQVEILVDGTVFRSSGPNPAAFERMGHSLFALSAALIGGLATRRFHDTRMPQPHAPGGKAP